MGLKVYKLIPHNKDNIQMTIENETVTKCICDKCHYEWNPRNGKEPRVCPQCKSYKWNKSHTKPRITNARHDAIKGRMGID